MENKYRKILQRAYRVISPEFDPNNWTDLEFQTVFINDVNYMLNLMVRKSKEIEDAKPKAPVWDGTPLVPDDAPKDFMKVVNVEDITNG